MSKYKFLLILQMIWIFTCTTPPPQKAFSVPQDTFDSFKDIGTVGIVVQDTSSLDVTYEQELYDMFYESGMTVVKIDTTSMDDDVYDSNNNTWSSLSLVVICFGTDSATVDTSIANGIGDVPLILLEPGYFTTFGLPDTTSTATQDTFVVNGTGFLSSQYADGDSLDLYGVDGGDQTYYAIGAPTYDSNAWLLTIDGGDTIAVYDTLNGVERIAFGLPVSNKYLTSSGLPFLGEGFTMLARGVSELTNSNADSLFTLVMFGKERAGSDWSKVGPTFDVHIANRLRMNGHDIFFASEDSITTSSTTLTHEGKLWTDFDGAVVYQLQSGNVTLDTLVSNIDKIWVGFLNGWLGDSLGVITGETRVTTTDSLVVGNNTHSITDFLTLGDEITIATSDQSFSDGTATAGAFGLLQDEDGKDILAASKTLKHVWFGFGPQAVSSIYEVGADTTFKLFDRAMGWLFTALPTAPSDVAITVNGVDTVTVTWTDNASNEDGYSVFMYSPDSAWVAHLAANTTEYGISPLFPPNSRVIVDVAVVSGTDSIFSVSGKDTAYTLAIVPPPVLMRALSDTLYNFSLHYPLYEDRFDDGEYTSDPVWSVQSGSWIVDTTLKVLRNTAGSSILSSPYQDIVAPFDSVDDSEWELSFKFNDSLSTSTQTFTFEFMNGKQSLTDSAGYSLSMSSTGALLVKRRNTSGTLVNLTASCSSQVSFATQELYKWHDLKVVRDWEASPIDSSLIFTVYLDGVSTLACSSAGFTDALSSGNHVNNSSYLGIQVSTATTGLEFDGITVFNLRPSTNHEFTQYAIEDSITGKWVVDEGDSLRDAEDWRYYSQWGAVNGDSLNFLSPDSAVRLRADARNEWGL